MISGVRLSHRMSSNWVTDFKRPRRLNKGISDLFIICRPSCYVWKHTPNDIVIGDYCLNVKVVRMMIFLDYFIDPVGGNTLSITVWK